MQAPGDYIQNSSFPSFNLFVLVSPCMIHFLKSPLLTRDKFKPSILVSMSYCNQTLEHFLVYAQAHKSNAPHQQLHIPYYPKYDSQHTSNSLIANGT